MKTETQLFISRILFAVVLISFFISFLTLKREREQHAIAMQSIRSQIQSCEPAVFLDNNEPLNAVALVEYRKSETGHVCVYMVNGVYGDLWWTRIVENQNKSHLEWNFTAKGNYLLPTIAYSVQ